MALNFPEEAINNRVAKVGVGAYLGTPTDTSVTTTYTRLLGTFTNKEADGFELDDDDKLVYNPTDGIARTFLFNASYAVKSSVVNASVKIGLEYGDGDTFRNADRM